MPNKRKKKGQRTIDLGYTGKAYNKKWFLKGRASKAGHNRKKGYRRTVSRKTRLRLW